MITRREAAMFWPWMLLWVLICLIGLGVKWLVKRLVRRRRP